MTTINLTVIKADGTPVYTQVTSEHGETEAEGWARAVHEALRWQAEWTFGAPVVGPVFMHDMQSDDETLEQWTFDELRDSLRGRWSSGRSAPKWDALRADLADRWL